MVSGLAVLIVLATIFGLMLGRRGHTLRPGLMSTRVRRASGPNLGSMVAVVGVAGLLLEAGNSSVAAVVPGLAPVLVAIAVVLIIGIVVAKSLTELIAGALGIGMLAMTVGVAGAIQLVVLIGLMLWLLGLARGFLG